uniref:Uncharacterized protein n=1 Tax=Rhizobium leguminosarum TaxID=384 RepID=A0A179C0H7_RHILE|nr:hypothetical protein A4U53_36740 [Rhizobium leguminosarum]
MRPLHHLLPHEEFADEMGNMGALGAPPHGNDPLAVDGAIVFDDNRSEMAFLFGRLHIALPRFSSGDSITGLPADSARVPDHFEATCIFYKNQCLAPEQFVLICDFSL